MAHITLVNMLHFLTLFIEHYLQGEYIFQCVIAASTDPDVWSHLSCRTALGNFIYSKLSVLNDTLHACFFLFSIE